MKIETLTPHDIMRPIGPYSHIAKAGPFVWISGTAGVDPATGRLAGSDVYSQATQILRSFRTLLAGIGCAMDRVTHVQVFLKRMDDFETMNRAYAEEFGSHRPARTVIGVGDLPKEGALLTMSLTAVVDDADGAP